MPNCGADPLVRQLDGFLGKWTLVSRDTPRRIVFFSFWMTPATVAEYQESVYPKVCDILAPLIETAPVAQVFDVRNGNADKLRVYLVTDAQPHRILHITDSRIC